MPGTQAEAAADAPVRQSEATAARMRELAANMAEQIAVLHDFAELTRQQLRNVSEIAQRIRSIAPNSTIEAARAGEAGRRFTVLAREVGRLSLKSADTAQRI